MKLVVFATLVLGLLTSCADRRSDEVALRAVALSYAFDHDEESIRAPGKWLFTVESDFASDDVARALSHYPLAQAPLKVDNRGSIERVDTLSGKRYAHWSIEVHRNQMGEIWADVGCVKGGLNGYGQLLLLEKKFGRWRVVHAGRSWIS